MNRLSALKLERLGRLGIALVLAFSLTSCGAGPQAAQSNSNTEFGTDSDGGNDSSINSDVWLTSEGDNGNGYTASCDFNGDEKDGDFVNCRVYWTAKNISSVPQPYSGYSYLNVSGAIYQSSDAYAEYRMVNPGMEASRTGYNSFSIPYGGTIFGLFKAEGPNEPHLLNLDLNISITN